MGSERTRKLEAAVKRSAVELRDYAANMLGDGETIGTHQDVATQLRRIAERLTDALPSRGRLDGLASALVLAAPHLVLRPSYARRNDGCG